MGHQKVVFQLEQDEEGYPPVGWEGVWATALPDGKFVLDNVPFFARAATLGDVVEAALEEGELRYKGTAERSGNSLVRIAYYENTDPAGVRRDLEAMGCSTELCGPYPLIAVNVPANVDLKKVQTFLQEGAAADKWSYEEPILMQ